MDNKNVRQLDSIMEIMIGQCEKLLENKKGSISPEEYEHLKKDLERIKAEHQDIKDAEKDLLK